MCRARRATSGVEASVAGDARATRAIGRDAAREIRFRSYRRGWGSARVVNRENVDRGGNRLFRAAGASADDDGWACAITRRRD
jgi:hypothetical protein